MLKSIIVGVICGLVFYQAQAQNLYIPRDVQGAFNKGTRSMDGKPGKNYWQNHARYNISITALPPDRNIKGVEQIVYFNNSPDTLKRLNMKLILNIHRPGAARFFGANPDYLTPGIQVDSIFINGTKKPWDNARASRTNQMVGLPKPLAPHDSVKLNITWHFEISKESGREGMIDSTSYYLAYYYPRVSVYDDYNGWDTLEFLDAQEFYNDFNDYTLNVTVPKNYLVWATGTCKTPIKCCNPNTLNGLSDRSPAIQPYI